MRRGRRRGLHRLSGLGELGRLTSTTAIGTIIIPDPIDPDPDPDPDPPAYDYTVSTLAEWDALFANSTATLNGKTVLVDTTILEPVNIANHDFATGITISSAPGVSLQRMTATGTVNNVTLDGLSMQMRGWPRDDDSCLYFNTGTYDGWLVKNSAFRHGYGPDQVDMDPETFYPEFVRPDHIETATTTSTRYALNWQDDEMPSGRFFCFNNGAQSYYVAFGDSTVVATASDTEVPPKAFAGDYRVIGGGDPTTDTHYAIISASGTTATNVRPEIGAAAYLADGVRAGGAAQISNFTFRDNTFSDFSNAVTISISGFAVYMRNVFKSYQDHIKGINSPDETFLIGNVFYQCLARSGIAQELDGHANDPHGDYMQGFADGSYSIGYVYMGGNVSIPYGTSTAQGAFLSDNDNAISYKGVISIADLLMGGSPNGISTGEDGSPAQGLLVYGSTIINYSDLSEYTNIRVVTVDAPYIGSTIIGGSINSPVPAATPDTLVLDGYVGDETVYFPDWDDLATATTRAEVLAATTGAGDAAGLGAAAHQHLIDLTTDDPLQAFKFDQIPSGLSFMPLVEQAVSSVVTWPSQLVLNRNDDQPIVPGAGVEVIVYASDGTTVLTDWTSSAVTADQGNRVAARVTSGASGTATFSLTTNGVAQELSVATAASLTDAFVLNGAYFYDAADVPANTSVIQLTIKGQLGATDYTGSHYFGTQVSALALVATSSGLYITAKNSANAGVTDGSTSNRMPMPGIGVTFTLDATYDYGNNLVTVTAGGETQITAMDPTTDGVAQSNRELIACTQSTIGTNKPPSDMLIESIKIHLTTGGVRTLHKEISVAALGSIAGINADPWTNGTVIAA